MARSRSTSQTPEDLGWPQENRPGGPTTSKRPAEVRSVPQAGEASKNHYTAPTIPDPNIQHGRLKVLQRVDGLFVIHDTKAAPGAGALVLIDPKRYRDTPEAIALTGKERDAEAKRQALRAADTEAKRLSVDFPDD